MELVALVLAELEADEIEVPPVELVVELLRFVIVMLE